MVDKTVGAKVTPADEGVIARLVTGVKYMLSGATPDAWFGPNQPLQPAAQEQAKGRQLDYPTGYNLRHNQRVDDNSVGYAELRNLADGYDLLRLVIETRKDQISKMEFDIVPKDKKATPDEKKQKFIKEFFSYPDKEHDWDTWLRAIIEEMLVTDAATVYPRYNRSKELYSLELMDGALIKRIIDDTGRTPLPPEPAYQQVLKGVPAVNYSKDELIYRPRNVRVHKIYGYSPVQQVIMTVNIALRRQVTQLQYYTEGNVPDALIGVPEEWSPEDISTFQKWWDEVLLGDTSQKSKARFVPGGMTPTFTKDAILKDGYDEWLARIICFAFNISPQSLVAMMNRATAESAMQQASQEGLAPLMKWVKSLMDFIIVKYFDEHDLHFVWKDEDEPGPKEQMEVLTGYVAGKIMHPDEAREKLGMEPFTDEQKEDMKPAPLPGIGPDGEPVPVDPEDPDKPTPPGQPKPPGAKEEAAKLGKSLKVSPINRNRVVVVKAIADLNKVISEAFKKDAVMLANEATKELTVAKSDLPPPMAKAIKSNISKSKQVIAKHLQVIHSDGVNEAALQLGVEFNTNQLKQVNKQSVKWSEAKSAELVKNIDIVTRDGVKAAVAEAIESGKSAQELADIIQNSYGFSDERAMLIARTETAMADIAGNIASYKEAGVTNKTWIANGSDSCDDCQGLHEVTVPIDDDFPNDGGDGPPYHPHCTCDIIPNFDEES